MVWQSGQHIFSLLHMSGYVHPLLFLPTLANFSSSVLDPDFKDMYFQHKWDSAQYDLGMKQLKAVVCSLLMTA